MASNKLKYEAVKDSIGDESGCINNSTNLSLIKMEIPFTEINVEELTSPTLYAFLSDVHSRVEKSPLYRTTMRDNLASKMIQALQRGNHSVVTQLRLDGVNLKNWEEIVEYLVAKFGGALKTQELAIQHHAGEERIGYPLESAIIKEQFRVIKEHLKATASIKEMIVYHQKHKSPAEARAYLQQGGHTERYLTKLNEVLPLINQSVNLNKLETVPHEEGFAMLEAQLQELHRSAQIMLNRYTAQPQQTLLINSVGSAKPSGSIDTKKVEEDGIKKLEERMDQEFKTMKNRAEREHNQM